MLLVLVEPDAADIHPSSLETLAMAGSLARRAGDPLEAVVFDRLGDGGAALLGRHGVSQVHVVEHPLVGDYSPELYGESLAQLIRNTVPTAVLAPATERGTETMAQAAARLDVPLATNCTAVDDGATDGGVDPVATLGASWRLTRIRQGGMVLEESELDANVKLVTVATGAVEVEPPADGGRPAAETAFAPDLDGVPCSRLVERTTRDGGVSLASARVVISGGRGVGSAEGFAPLEELAKLTGGAVGCSRVATNNGWRPHSDQVGQTGTKISPDLYVACGISGATQHWVGCMGAKNILAINTDPEAPLVNRATYAVLGDVAEVLPAVIDELHRRRAGSP